MLQNIRVMLVGDDVEAGSIHIGFLVTSEHVVSLVREAVREEPPPSCIRSSVFGGEVFPVTPDQVVALIGEPQLFREPAPDPAANEPAPPPL